MALALCLTVVTSVAPAAVDATDQAAERARLAREAESVHARHAQAVAACAGRFALNACLEQAHAERRQAWLPLRQAEAALDDARRRARAQARLQAIEARRASAASR